MARLSPPIIEGTIPAFYKDKNGTVKITVPFSINRSVSPTQVDGFSLKIKTSQSSTYLFTIETKDEDVFKGFDKENFNYVTFKLTDKTQIAQLKEGMFYKVQLAFLNKIEDKDNKYEVGYYSSVGIGKYTTEPTVEIANMTFGVINAHTYTYLGTYSQSKRDGVLRDISEKVSFYQFDVYDDLDNLIHSSGKMLHNAANDDMVDGSEDIFTLPYDLVLGKSYYIKYTIYTNNNLIVSTPKYRIMQKLSIDPEIDATVEVELNYENGYVDIDLVGRKNSEGNETVVSGAFLLSRSCSDTDFTVWDEVSRFKLTAQYPSRKLWRDFTVEQGKTYKYSIQQYNDVGLYSNRLLSKELFVDFEHAFLSDGKRQLKIKYNPKITSFKTIVQETKMDTLGSKYPFIFRNGNVYYHEFPISGLISYLMDEEYLFLTEEDYSSLENSTNLTGENISRERTFKLEVLKWLTNGEPKIFRSPAEGNYIVRLMNVSLAPNDVVGRMLHTFTCTAYEIADYTYMELDKYGFISLDDPENPILRFETVEFGQSTGKGDYSVTSGKVNQHPAYAIQIINVVPGNKFKFTFEDGSIEVITIGVTGAYMLDIDKAVVSIEIPDGQSYYQGSLTYGYYSISENIFDKVHNVTVTEIPAEQFIGEHDILYDLEYILIDGEYIKNPKVDVIQVYSIAADARIVMETRRVEKNGSYEYQTQGGMPITDFNDFVLYAYGYWTTEADFNETRSQQIFIAEGYYDPMQNKIYTVKEFKDDVYQPLLQVNDNIVSMADYQGLFTMKDLERPSVLKLGNGAMAEISYQIRTIDYLIELKDPVKSVRTTYENAQLALDNHRESNWEESSGKTFEAWYEEYLETEAFLKTSADKAYKNYISVLYTELENMKNMEE